jgi:hypothetical protein
MRTKTRKLAKVKKYILPKLSGVDIFDIKKDNLKVFLNSNLHIHVEYWRGKDFIYHVWVNKIYEFETLDKWVGINLGGCRCKNYPEIYEFIKSILLKDKDYVFSLRKEKLERLMK